MKRFLMLSLLLVMVVGGLFYTPLPSSAAPKATIPISISDSSITVPDEVEGGLTTLTFNNTGQTPHMPGFARLKDGETPETFAAAGPAALSLIEGLVAPGVLMPGLGDSVIADLTPGTWLVADQFDPMIPPVFVTVVAGDGDGTQVPEDAPVVQFRDFAFTGIPTTVNAGKTTWKLENKGSQFHEVIVYQVEEGVTPQDFLATFDGQSPPDGIPFGAGVNSPGGTIWKEFTFTPGNYIAVCLVPDEDSGAPHAQLGMVTTFTVADAPAALPQTGAAVPWYLTWLGWGAVGVVLLLTVRAVMVRNAAR